MSQYIACGTSSSKSASKPCVLKRTGAGDWTKVHESATTGAFAFAAIHGTSYGSLIVAAGNATLQNFAASYNGGCLSYFKNGVWTEVTVPALHSFGSVYVVNDDLVYLGGGDMIYGTGDAILWSWKPSAPTVFNEILRRNCGTPGNDRPHFCSVSGSGWNDVWASMYTGTDFANGSQPLGLYYHFDGTSWSAPVGPNGNNVLSSQFDALSAGVAFCNAMDSPDYTGWWNGSSWAWASRTEVTASYPFSAAAISDGIGIVAYLAGNAWIGKLDGATLTPKVDLGAGQQCWARIGWNKLDVIGGRFDWSNGASAITESDDAGDTWSGLVALVDDAASPYYFARDCYIEADYPIQPTPTEQPPTGPYQLINNRNDYEIVNDGFLDRDKTIASRCRARLCTRRGQWIGDLSLGSRLHTIKILKNARQLAMIYINEALQPMINAGEIKEINALEFVEDPITGALGVSVEVVLPAGETVPLGVVAIGG